MLDKILKYLDNEKIVILTLSIVVIIGAIMTDLTKEIVLTSLGGLIGYLTAKHNRV
jgi:hypothetical protein